ncbi:MAG: ferritin family protein [Anaerolineae bacterium]|jgi:rubrerythrin
MEGNVKKALGALTMAIRVEQNGYRFYRRAAEETEDPQGKALFNRLAEDEVAHENIIRARLEALDREGTWMAVSDEEWPDESPFTEGEPIFSRERLEQDVHDYTSELSALRMAYLIEKNAVVFYTKAARETEDPAGRAMYQDLAEWERAHQRVLEQEYRFLASRFKLDMGFAPF